MGPSSESFIYRLRDQDNSFILPVPYFPLVLSKNKIVTTLYEYSGLPWWLRGKESACNAETRVRSLSWEDPLEKEMATHSSTLAWKIPWTEEPGRLQSMGLQRVRHD